MYLEQVKKFTSNPILYFVLPVAFLLLMIANYVFSMDVDTNKVINQLIEQVGVNVAFVLMIAPLSVGLFFVWFWVKIIQRQSITSLTTSRKKVDFKRIFFSFFLWASFTIVMTYIAYAIEPENFVVNFKPKKFLLFLCLAIILIPLQTSFEEYLFRGNLMQGLALVTKSRLLSLLLPAILFGLMHMANPEVVKIGPIIMIYYIGTGLFLGILTIMDEGLELALGFHAANNLIGALLVTADWTAFQTHSILKDVSEPSGSFEIILPIFVIFPILLFIFSKIYKWKNWKQKLTGTIDLN
ncbi:MAG: CPBP family intramembrane metalloprotease domain-containing protein [Flavobacterium sp.]|uniref:CPBP family intramembrane glutamic endopeptidase n=1 Tax=Flavobacterium sp. TaxID=239 RepID=UPI000C496AAB|nr:CPBP family intramembrane glutamic endopeptidase [Flavobacterium sp.]MBF03696.1 CPBP family intramembrane metalloprotease domain-containing protein [Flavobacterium sp.]|tara:strand:- start:41 stop:931 length:891 start_codon:yes stop_codon:yes gene_type:complete